MLFPFIEFKECWINKFIIVFKHFYPGQVIQIRYFDGAALQTFMDNSGCDINVIK